MNNLDLSGINLIPIGNDSSNFEGIFNGNGNAIKNATINMPSTDNVGLFGFLGEKSIVVNLGVENVNVVGKDNVGTIGQSLGIISRCYATGNVSGSHYVGGLVGRMCDGEIVNSYATTNVNGGLGSYTLAGGLVGYGFGSIINCFATGNIVGGGDVGGLVGEINSCTITNSYSTGNVTGNERVGGLVGDNVYGVILDCYSVGQVIGSSYIGGLVGRNYGRTTSRSGTIKNCFWDIETSGQYIGYTLDINYPGTVVNVIGKFTPEMQDINTGHL